MRVLVTGATGGLGRNAVDFLLEQGVDVRATGRNAQVGSALRQRGAQFMGLDLVTADGPALRALLDGVHAVWHCAALSSPWGARERFQDCNVRATSRLVQAAGECGVSRFIHVSTPAIYFDYSHRHGVNESFRARRPVNHYARTKALAEDAVQEAGLRFPSMRVAILRPRAIFGPHDQVLVPRLQEMLRQHGGRLPLPRGGRAVIDMTYVGNVVQAMWLATRRAELSSGLAFNITNGEPAPIAEVLHRLFTRELGWRMQILDIPPLALAAAATVMECQALFTRREPRLTRYSVGVLSYDMTLDLARARALLGYEPAVSLEQGIARTADWLKSHG